MQIDRSGKVSSTSRNPSDSISSGVHTALTTKPRSAAVRQCAMGSPARARDSTPSRMPPRPASAQRRMAVPSSAGSTIMAAAKRPGQRCRQSTR